MSAAGWRRLGSGEKAPPIEMRFVDMFMAALGALVFMAMLFAFLLASQPPPPPPDGKRPESRSWLAQAGPLRLATTSLPAARAGDTYEVPLAYRGGQGNVIWELAAGQVPPGIRFDPGRGALAGKPSKEGVSSFVVRALDHVGSSDQRPFELLVQAPLTGSKTWEKVLAIGLLGLLGLITAVFFAVSMSTDRLTRSLEQAYQEGQTQFNYQRRPFEFVSITLPDGIVRSATEARQAAFIAKLLLTTCLIVAAWFIWRVWFQH